MTNAASKPTPEAPQEPKKPPNPILNNFLSAAVFGAFDAALLTYLKTAQNLPENLRNPIYVMSVIVMMIVLGQFAFNTALFMHAKHRDELDKFRRARELKDLQHRKSVIKEEIDIIKLERDKETLEGKRAQHEISANVSSVAATIETKTPQQTATERVDLSGYQMTKTGQEVTGQEVVENRNNTQ